MNTISTILKELISVCENISETEYKTLVKLMKEDNVFYFAGEGRSGIVAKAIAMRLMHSGKEVYVVGESTTPAIGENDVLILISGSGKTNQIVHLGKQASAYGAYVFLVTSNKKALSHIWCASGLHIPAATKDRKYNESKTIQPLGNQFDQSAHIILDAAIIDSMKLKKDKKTMIAKHTNLE